MNENIIIRATKPRLRATAENRAIDNPYRFIYQDESGDIGKSKCPFVVGLLFVRGRRSLRDTIKGVRQRYGFKNELHFNQISDLRTKVYLDILQTMAPLSRSDGVFPARYEFHAIVVEKELVDMKRFDYKRHLAYNFFTRLLLWKRSTRAANAVMLCDEKSRIKEDNFFDYLQTQINRMAARDVLRKVESLDSKKDDLMQFTDLLIGAVSNFYTASSQQEEKTRKQKIRERAVELGILDKSRAVWEWRPNKRFYDSLGHWQKEKLPNLPS